MDCETRDITNIFASEWIIFVSFTIYTIIILLGMLFEYNIDLNFTICKKQQFVIKICKQNVHHTKGLLTVSLTGGGGAQWAKIKVHRTLVK